MKIGVISDIHDNIGNLLKTTKILNKEKVEQIFFCGDLSSPFTMSYFGKLKAPIKAVFGNNEGDKLGIMRRIKKYDLKIEYAPKQGLMWNVKLLNKKIAVFHGHQYEITENLVNSGLFDIVLTGHTHSPHIKNVGKTLWINPGPICGWAGLDVKPTKPSLAVVDLETKKAEVVYL